MIKLLEAYEIPELFKIMSDPYVSENLVADTTVITENNLFPFLLFSQSGTTAVAYSIYSKEELVGVITLNNISLIKKSAYIGITAVKKTSKGIAGITAAKWLLAHCFDTLGLNRVYAHSWTDNDKMDHFYKLLGATHEGTEREHTWKQGRFVDLKIWAILAREYYGNTGS